MSIIDKNDSIYNSIYKECKCSEISKRFNPHEFYYACAYCEQHNRLFNNRWRDKYYFQPQSYLHGYHVRLSFNNPVESKLMTSLFSEYRQKKLPKHKYIKRIHWIDTGFEHMHLQCIFLFKEKIDHIKAKEDWKAVLQKREISVRKDACYFDPFTKSYYHNLYYIFPNNNDPSKQQLPPRGKFRHLVSGSYTWHD